MSAEGKELLIKLGVGTFAIGCYIFYAGSREGNNPSVAELPDRNDGRPAFPTGSPTGISGATASEQTNPISNESTPHTLRLGVPPNCIPTPPGYITNQSNCAIYELKPHPTEPGKLCAEKGSHDPDNERTLYGLGFAVSDGFENPILIVNPKTNEIIGYFPAGVQPTFEGMNSSASNESLACLYYGGVTSGILESSIDQ